VWFGVHAMHPASPHDVKLRIEGRRESSVQDRELDGSVRMVTGDA
jgi:hypothetical protein